MLDEIELNRTRRHCRISSVKWKAEPIRTGKPGRPSEGKTLVSMRLSDATLAALRALGPGWTTAANRILGAAVGA